MARSSLSPGFRFHPTDVELVMYYLKRKLLGKKLIVEAIAEVNIYDFSPWDLPDISNLRTGDLKWFFFCPKARKYSSGSRSNRATETGFWKATGKDRPVEYKQRTVATIKTLVFHLGHAPNGQRTNWVMHEYRMEDKDLANAGVVQDMYVLCKIFEKSGAGPKNGAQYGAPFNEEEWDDDIVSCPECPAVVGPDGATNTVNCKQNSPATMDITGPQITYSLSLIEPGSSTVTSSANEKHGDVPANDDAVLTVEELASNLDDFPKGPNGKNKNEEVEVVKVQSVAPNEDDGIYDDLVNLINLEELDAVASNMLKIDGADYRLDTFLTADDLDVDLSDFYVD